jgi:hypothetical protein
LYGGNFSFSPSLPATAAIPGPAEGNFGERNVCNGLDAQDCARIANVQAEEIERLHDVLERYLSRLDERSNHEKIFEIGDSDERVLFELMDVVDQPHDGTHCPRLSLESTAVAHHFDSLYLTFFVCAQCQSGRTSP